MLIQQTTEGPQQTTIRDHCNRHCNQIISTSLIALSRAPNSSSPLWYSGALEKRRKEILDLYQEVIS